MHQLFLKITFAIKFSPNYVLWLKYRHSDTRYTDTNSQVITYLNRASHFTGGSLNSPTGRTCRTARLLPFTVLLFWDRKGPKGIANVLGWLLSAIFSFTTGSMTWLVFFIRKLRYWQKDVWPDGKQLVQLIDIRVSYCRWKTCE